MTDTVEPKAPGWADPKDYPATIPDFKTEEEIRDFWDTHDSAFYWDQMEDVTHNPPPELRQGPGREGSRRMDLVSLLLPLETIEQVKLIAARRHLPYQTLMRSWIGERLDQELTAHDKES